MKRTQRERIAAQLVKIKAAIDFDELGALHEELKDGSEEKAMLFSVCDKLDSAVFMLEALEAKK